MPIRTIGDLNRFEAMAQALGGSADRVSTGRRAEAELAQTQAKAASDAAFRFAEMGIKQQTADAATTSAAARTRGGVEVIPGMPGEPPLLVNKETGRAAKALVVPSFSEFDARMREDSRNADMTQAEMMEAYQEQFGQ